MKLLLAIFDCFISFICLAGAYAWFLKAIKLFGRV